MLFGFDHLLELCTPSRVIVADEHVARLYGQEVQELLDAPLIKLPRGEAAKRREVKHAVEDQMFALGCGKETTVVGMGGGAACDLATFVAATYMRGVPLILVPTTLLALVDASVGGKGGVNTPHGKNLIGAIYQPRAVVADLKTLETLPMSEWTNGWAEILKMGLIAEPTLLEKSELKGVIARAAEAKRQIVSQDIEDKGVRRILNFGHTIAHALEAQSSFALSHGEAVAIGTLAACDLSVGLGYLGEGDFAWIEHLYFERLGKISLPKGYDRKKVTCALAADKKRTAEGVRFVLLERIGKAHTFDGAYCQVVAPDRIEQVLEAMERRHGHL